MTQVLPEGKTYFREDTLPKNTYEPTTSDVIVLGEDLVDLYDYTDDIQDDLADDSMDELPSPQSPDFIGPRDATNESRVYLSQRAKNLAEIAVMKFVAYEDERARLIKDVNERVHEGTIRLGDDYSDMSASEQVEHFVKDTVNEAFKPRADVEAAIAAEKAAINLGSRGPERELQIEVNGLRGSVEKQSRRIFKVREMLIEGGAGEEFMRKFDYTMKLMTRPELEAYEIEMNLDPEHTDTPPLVDTAQLNLFERFRSVLSPSFGFLALQRIGIFSPKTGQSTAVKQKELR